MDRPKFLDNLRICGTITLEMCWTGDVKFCLVYASVLHKLPRYNQSQPHSGNSSKSRDTGTFHPLNLEAQEALIAGPWELIIH